MEVDRDVKTVMLAGGGDLSRLIFHKLNAKDKIDKIITEEPESRAGFLRRRVKNLGYLKVFGQVLFKIFVESVLNFISTGRIEEILEDNDLRVDQLPEENHLHVSSVNSERTVEILGDIDPDLVIVNGTRLIAPEVFRSIDAPFVNVHVGITPRYRGVHGGYWALVEGRRELFGVTVHLIDEGVDTGPILYQTHVEFTDEDNFITYPYLQVTAAIELLEEVIEDTKERNLSSAGTPGIESRCWTHPTLWGYLYNRLMHGKK